MHDAVQVETASSHGMLLRRTRAGQSLLPDPAAGQHSLSAENNFVQHCLPCGLSCCPCTATIEVLQVQLPAFDWQHEFGGPLQVASIGSSSKKCRVRRGRRESSMEAAPRKRPNILVRQATK